jgi:aldehyde:ferredoxin oxidoreductase
MPSHPGWREWMKGYAPILGEAPWQQSCWAVSYATVPRGGCHITAPTYWLERGITFPDLGFAEPLDRFSTASKGKWAVVFQNFCEVLESMVTCKFAIYGGLRSEHVTRMISLCTGWNVELEELLRIGERANAVKRLINLSLGIDRKADTLPKRVLSLSLKEGGSKGHLPDQDTMIADYYRFRGWSKEGRPTRETFDALGISDALGEEYHAYLD